MRRCDQIASTDGQIEHWADGNGPARRQLFGNLRACTAGAAYGYASGYMRLGFSNIR